MWASKVLALGISQNAPLIKRNETTDQRQFFLTQPQALKYNNVPTVNDITESTDCIT